MKAITHGSALSMKIIPPLSRLEAGVNTWQWSHMSTETTLEAVPFPEQTGSRPLPRKSMFHWNRLQVWERAGPVCPISIACRGRRHLLRAWRGAPLVHWHRDTSCPAAAPSPRLPSYHASGLGRACMPSSDREFCVHGQGGRRKPGLPSHCRLASLSGTNTKAYHSHIKRQVRQGTTPNESTLGLEHCELSSCMAWETGATPWEADIS